MDSKFIKIGDYLYNKNFIQKITVNGQWLHVYTTTGDVDDIQFSSENYAKERLSSINNCLNKNA